MEEVIEFLKLKRKPTKEEYLYFSLLCHPDHVGSVGTYVFKELNDLYNGIPAAPKFIFSTGGIDAIEVLAEGSISTIYKTNTKSILKLAFGSEYNGLLRQEFDALSKIKKYLDEHSSLFYIQPVRSISVRGRTANLITTGNGAPLSHWSKLDNRHLIWMIKRLASGLSIAHHLKIIHGTISPEHILVDYKNHGIKLLDWCFSGNVGFEQKKLPTLDGRPPEKQYSEATDVYMIGSTFLRYATEPKIKRYLEYLCVSNPLRRPTVWQIFNEINELSDRIYGKRKFVELTF